MLRSLLQFISSKTVDLSQRETIAMHPNSKHCEINVDVLSPSLELNSTSTCELKKERRRKKNINTDTQWRSMTFIFSHFCCLLLWLIALQLWFVFHCIDILHAAQRSPFGVRARASKMKMQQEVNEVRLIIYCQYLLEQSVSVFLVCRAGRE